MPKFMVAIANFYDYKIEQKVVEIDTKKRALMWALQSKGFEREYLIGKDLVHFAYTMGYLISARRLDKQCLNSQN